MINIIVAGAGKIGSLICSLLATSGDYQVTLIDKQFTGHDVQRVLDSISDINTAELDLNDHDALDTFLQTQSHHALISCLPYFMNETVAAAAKKHGLHYFDLTEDTQVTDAVAQLAETAETAFVPQCGLAPGFISIAANSLMQQFDSLDTVKLRVGALPQHTNNALQYALTWSTEGLINEYGNPCFAIRDGARAQMRPLEGLELIKLDGQTYEAFNTSGGLGSLSNTYKAKVRNLDYKTIRFPGHCEKMKVLMNDLRLNDDRKTLKYILERAIPKTYQDVVIVYVSVSGHINNEYIEKNYMRKIYPATIADITWSAIQVTTASGICAVVDMVLNKPSEFSGLILQERFGLDDFLDNRFGRYYA